jgi:hypothetical protein
MKTVQLKRTKNTNWEYVSEKLDLRAPLVLVFGNRFLLEDKAIFKEIQAVFKDGHIVFGSSCGDIISNSVDENSITITAVEFEKSSFLIKTKNVLDAKLGVEIDSLRIGKELIAQFPQENLKHVFIISEGSFINGSQLTKGMNAATNNNFSITGALCGDDARFEKTIASYNEKPKSGEIVAIGLYGTSLEVTFSIKGGWTPFGPERIVTRSKGNILYELDNLPALDLYKQYLGDKSKELPSAALLYPLNVKSENEDQPIVRTILNINEAENSMILAGDIFENSTVQLMMTNPDNIVEAAERAAINALEFRNKKPELAILVSCIGRKLVLDQRIEEEVEEVIEVVGNTVTVTGLYSYGEIAPFIGESNCQLHNQTMTITLISE